MLLSYRKWTIPQTFVVRRIFFCRFFLRPSCGRLFPPTRHLAAALFHLPQIPFSLCPPSTASSNTRNSKHATLPQATRINLAIFLDCLGYFDFACGVLFPTGFYRSRAWIYVCLSFSPIVLPSFFLFFVDGGECKDGPYNSTC